MGADPVGWFSVDVATFTCRDGGGARLGHDAAAWRLPGFLLDNVHPSERADLEAAVGATLREGTTHRARCRLRDGEGVWRSLVLVTEPSRCEPPGGEQLVRVTYVDVTDWLREDAERREAAALGARERARAATEREVRAIAHDLNNRLAAILALARLLERKQADPAAITRLVAGLREAAERGVPLVERIRGLARTPPAEPPPDAEE